MLITGIGGTGVVTIGAIMGMAAHIEGKGVTVLDQLGMAQKGGAVISHVRIGATPEALHAVRLGAGGANLLLGCDLVVSASADALARLEPGTSHAVVNTHETITGEFTRHPDLAFPANTLKLSIEAAAGAEACDFLEADQASPRRCWAIRSPPTCSCWAMPTRRASIPLGHESLERAIELNGAAVAMNLAAFRWGRRAAFDRAAVEKLVAPSDDKVVPFAKLSRTLDEIVAVAGEASHRLSERRPGPSATRRWSSRVRARRTEDAGQDGPRRSGGAQLRQAAGLQGRVRGGAAPCRRGLRRPSSTSSSRATTS